MNIFERITWLLQLIEPRMKLNPLYLFLCGEWGSCNLFSNASFGILWSVTVIHSTRSLFVFFCLHSVTPPEWCMLFTAFGQLSKGLMNKVKNHSHEYFLGDYEHKTSRMRSSNSVNYFPNSWSDHLLVHMIGVWWNVFSLWQFRGAEFRLGWCNIVMSDVLDTL